MSIVSVSLAIWAIPIQQKQSGTSIQTKLCDTAASIEWTAGFPFKALRI